MPKDNIERAIAKGTGADSDGETFESIVYEGYGPGGVAILVEALTDNRNRTGSEVRTCSPRPAAAWASRAPWPGPSRRRARWWSTATRYAEDDLLAAIDAGAEDVSLDDDVWEIVTGPAELAGVRAALEAAGVELESAELVMRPTTRTPVEEDQVGSLMRLIEASRTTTTSRRCTPTSTSTPTCSSASLPSRGTIERKASAPARRIPHVVVVLGIDPGTANTGYGVVLSRGRTLAALDGGVIETRSGRRSSAGSPRSTRASAT